jgi:hypothetical protein
MLDTSSEIEKRVIQLMSLKTPTQRLKMVSSMFATSKKLIQAGLEKEKGRSLTLAEKRAGIFIRMYSDSFTQSEIEKILNSIPNMQL